MTEHEHEWMEMTEPFDMWRWWRCVLCGAITAKNPYHD